MDADIRAQIHTIKASLQRYLPKPLDEPFEPAALQSCAAHLDALLQAVPTYLPRYLVEEQLAHPRPGRVSGQFREATLPFADISGLTAMSERLSRQGQQGAEAIANKEREMSAPSAPTEHAPPVQAVRLIVSGLGNIGRRYLQVLIDKASLLRVRYNLQFLVVGAADSRGAAHDPAGLDLAEIVRLKEAGGSMADYPGGRAAMTPLALVEQLDADVLCESTPVNLQDGEPGLSCMRAAMRKGMHVVTPNKGPLVLAFPELTTLAQAHGVHLRYCGTVAGGLPAINLGQRDLAGAIIDRLEALPNLTTSYILDQMTQGLTYDQALAAAQAQGCAEADPSLDVEGWDAANKLVILANSVLGIPATLDDVSVKGITGVTLADLQRARANGQVIKLVATATLEEGRYSLAVAPTPLPTEHPLAQLGGQQMGIVYHTDIYGTISASILETNPVPSAATMLRDLLSIYGS